jgi:hypothetical protein
VVLKFDSPELAARWQAARDAGASWDYDGYHPHVTITYDGGGVDLSGVQPFAGDLVFGPEVHAPLNESWAEDKGFRKAADDSGMTNAQIAAQIARSVSLRDLESLDAYADLFEVANDSGALATASVGADGLTDQVFQRAADFARERAATLVSLQGSDNIVQPTRDMIRDVIAKGLDDNLGADKIADLVQASTAFSEERADLIARTEIANANGQGKLEGWRAATETGLTLTKSWLTAGACCDDCALNEAAGAIDLEDDFPSGDDAEPAHPACKCVTIAAEAEE